MNEPLMDGMEQAWVLIANAMDKIDDSDWLAAAERWRDTQWHPYLSKWISDNPQSTTHGNFGPGFEGGEDQ